MHCVTNSPTYNLALSSSHFNFHPERPMILATVEVISEVSQTVTLHSV